MACISENVLVSILVPVYNVQKYLRQCLNSIIAQTYDCLEIILVDDGSTDESGNICDYYAKKDSRIQVIHKENGGLVSARKTAVNKATGSYAICVDSDDWIETDMVEVLLAEALKHNADMVTSGVWREYGNHTVEEFDYFESGVYDREMIERSIFPKLICTDKFFQWGLNTHIYNKLFKCDLLRKNQNLALDSIRIGEDAAVVYPFVFEVKCIIVTKNIFYHYRMRENSIMDSYFKEEYERTKLLITYLRERMKTLKLMNVTEQSIQNELKGQLERQLQFLEKFLLIMKEPDRVIKIKKDKTVYPFTNLKSDDKIILYGAGRVGESVYYTFKKLNCCKIICRADQRKSENKKIIGIEEIKQYKYDKIVLGIGNKQVADQAEQQLLEMKIKRDKICRINFD